MSFLQEDVNIVSLGGVYEFTYLRELSPKDRVLKRFLVKILLFKSLKEFADWQVSQIHSGS